jgi:hypothetical protein
MPRSSAPAIPMTLGNMREQGVRSLSVSCWQCHHMARSSAPTLGQTGFMCRLSARTWCAPLRDDRCGCEAELEGTARAGEPDRGACPKLDSRRKYSGENAFMIRMEIYECTEECFQPIVR